MPVPASLKVTVPTVTGAPPAVTVAVNVTGCPNPDGFTSEANAVLVGARAVTVRHQPAVMVPESAVLTQAGTSRVYVVNGDKVEERIVTTGQQIDAFVEIATGLKAGEKVATKNVAQLFDGAKVS